MKQHVVGVEKASQFNMRVTHLVVNGCSFSYCQNLENLTEEGWPRLLSDRLNIPLVNISVKGTSNESICRRAVEYHYLDTQANITSPLYIIGFTSSLRREEYLSEFGTKGIYQLQLANPYNHVATALSKQLDKEGIVHMDKRKVLNWLFLINFFKSNNIPYLSLDFIPFRDLEGLLIEYKMLHDLIVNDEYACKHVYDIVDQLDKSLFLPCGHHSKRAQHIIADYLYDEIQNKHSQIQIQPQSKYLTAQEYYKDDPIIKTEWP